METSDNRYTANRRKQIEYLYVRGGTAPQVRGTSVMCEGRFRLEGTKLTGVCRYSPRPPSINHRTRRDIAAGVQFSPGMHVHVCPGLSCNALKKKGLVDNLQDG